VTTPKRIRRRRKPIDLKRVQIALGEAIEQLEHYIVEPAARGETTDLETLLKVSYALAQVAGSFKGIVDAAEFQRELDEVRAEVARVAAELAKERNAPE
jgi:hypothetical protein